MEQPIGTDGTARVSRNVDLIANVVGLDARAPSRRPIGRSILFLYDCVILQLLFVRRTPTVGIPKSHKFIPNQSNNPYMLSILFYYTYTRTSRKRCKRLCSTTFPYWFYNIASSTLRLSFYILLLSHIFPTFFFNFKLI